MQQTLQCLATSLFSQIGLQNTKKYSMYKLAHQMYELMMLTTLLHTLLSYETNHFTTRLKLSAKVKYKFL